MAYIDLKTVVAIIVLVYSLSACTDKRKNEILTSKDSAAEQTRIQGLAVPGDVKFTSRLVREARTDCVGHSLIDLPADFYLVDGSSASFLPAGLPEDIDLINVMPVVAKNCCKVTIGKSPSYLESVFAKIFRRQPPKNCVFFSTGNIRDCTVAKLRWNAKIDARVVLWPTIRCNSSNPILGGVLWSGDYATYMGVEL